MALARSALVCRTLINRKINTLIKEECVSCHKFHSGSTFLKNRRNFKEPINVAIKSSRPLNESVLGEEKRKKPRKPERYMVFGDVSVDEETFTKMQEEESDFEDFDEEDLRNVLQNRDELYAMYQREAHEHRRFISKKTLERKVFPRQIEPSLLTWAAKEQVKYLHGLDPDQWTAEEVAKHFPISVLGAKKLLRSTFRYATENKIKLLDENVKKNWIQIQKGEVENLDPSLQEKWFNKQLNPGQALPNSRLPLPPPRNPNPSPLLLDDPNKPVGEFYALVKPYVDLTKQAKDLENQNKICEPAEHSNSIMRQNVKKVNDLQPSFMRNDTSQTLGDELGETDTKAYRKKMQRTMHVTHEQFEENMKDFLKNKKRKTHEDEEMLTWLENQKTLESGEHVDTSPPRFIDQDSDTEERGKKYKKYKEQHYVHFNTPRDDNHSEYEQAYRYSYQQPSEKSDNTDTGKIDKKLKKEGELYQFGDSFYSEEGEFVFRVFTK